MSGGSGYEKSNSSLGITRMRYPTRVENVKVSVRSKRGRESSIKEKKKKRNDKKKRKIKIKTVYILRESYLRVANYRKIPHEDIVERRNNDLPAGQNKREKERQKDREKERERPLRAARKSITPTFPFLGTASVFPAADWHRVLSHK